MEASETLGDAVCPRCGVLVVRLKELLHGIGYSPDTFNLLTPFASEVDQDSLDTVELFLQFQEEFDLQITDEEAETIITVADAIRFILKRKYGFTDEELPPS